MDKKCFSLCGKVSYPQLGTCGKGTDMANLFDGIRKAGKSETARLLCDFQVNRISVLLRIVLQCICYALMFVVQKILLVFKKEISVRPVYFLKKRYEMQYEKYILLEEEELEEILVKTLKGKLYFLGLPVKKSEDRVSAEITKLVAKLYLKEELKGLSVLEKNDYICKKYPSQKRLDEKISLLLWLVVSFFVLAASVIFWISGNEFRLPVLLSCIIFEIIWGYFISYKLLQWQFAHFMWLSSQGLGQPFSAKVSEATRYFKDPDKEKNGQELLIYHSLQGRKEKNLEPWDATILADLITIRENIEKEKLRKRWEKRFPKLEYTDSFISASVKACSYEDYGKIELRLAELSLSKDPGALAIKKKSEYKMDFRTVQGDIGSIYFTASKDKSKRLCMCRVERKGILKQALLSKDKLRQVLKKEDCRIGQIYYDFLVFFIPKEEEVDSLNQRLKQLEQQMENAKQRIQEKKAEAATLTKQISDRELECEEIRNKLAKSGLSDNDFETQRQAILKAQREIPVLRSENSRCEKELNAVSKEYDTYAGKREVLRQDVEDINRKLEKKRKDFLGSVKDELQKKLKNDQKDMDYLLGEMLVKKIDL